MTPTQTIGVLTPWLPLVTVLVTLVAFLVGLSAWRRETVGKRRFAVAEEILVTTYKLQRELAWVRDPAAFGGEGQTRPREPGPERASDVKNSYFVPLERMRTMQGDLAEFSKTKILALVHLGPQAGKPFDTVIDTYGEVAFAAGMLIRMAGQPRGEAGQKTAETFERAIWAMGTDDPLTKSVDDAVRDIEKLCRPLLRI